MSQNRRSFHPFALPVPDRSRAPRAVALLLVAVAACAPEEKYGTAVATPRDDDKRAATDPDAQRCRRFDARYRADFKACEVDADCELVTFRSPCARLNAYAIATADREEFLECAPRTDDCEVAVTSGHAEDGRDFADVAELSDIEARCFEGMCDARVVSRACGSSATVCGDEELCMSFLNASGVTEFQCVHNPCLGRELHCSCAAAVCQGLDGPVRVCTIEQIDDADVYCKAERR